MDNKDIQTTRSKVEAGLARRRRKEKSFQVFGMLATAVGILFLAVFFTTLVMEGSSAFRQTFVTLEFEFSEELLTTDGEFDLAYADFDAVVRTAIRARFPDVKDRRERRELSRLVSVGASYQLRDLLRVNPGLLGKSATVSVPTDRKSVV